MPQYTDNYGLIKPYETENYDVEVQNSNMDKIDLLIKTAEDKIEDKINVLDNKLKKHKEDYAQQRQQDQLKVAMVEKELNDYKATMQQVNINQEPKQKVSGYGTVSLPKNAANGQISVTIGGQTWTNLIDGAEVAPDDSRTFDSIDGHIYFDLHNGVIITGDGTEKTITNSSEQIANMAVFDLTQIYGQGNEPTAEQAQARLHYITGTKSTVGAIRVKSVGKNLFEPTLNGWIKDAGGALTLNDSVFTYKRTSGGNFDEIYKFFKVIPNQPYTLQLNVLSIANVVRVRAYDKTIDGTILGSKTFGSIGLQTITFTPQTEDVVIAFGGSFSNSECSFNFVQLEKGDQATDYEPYKESNAYVIAKDEELRSLPNGTKDEVRLSEGKAIIRIGAKTNVASSTVINYTDMADGGQFVAYYEDGTQQVGIKGDTLTAIATTLIYQLAEPVEIPVQVSGTLIGHPSGTVYLEPFVPDAGIYDGGISILHHDLPIKSIERISKIDYTTGLEYDLDVSKATIAQDKLSFTHPDIEDGDIIFFVYEYDRESTTGEMAVEYYDSRFVVEDSAVPGKFYKIKFVVTNGVASIVLEEV